MSLYRVKFGEDWSSNFGREQPNRNYVARSRTGLEYVVEYLRKYWADFRNLFTILIHFMCR